MSIDFGKRLQAERRTRGLSQAALGDDAYSASYISLIESGRRAPTPAFIQHAAGVLELPPSQLTAWADDTDDRLVEVTELSLQSTARAEDGDLLGAAEIAQQAAAVAKDAEELSMHWSMLHRAAQLLRRAGRAEESLSLQLQLLDLDVTAESPELTAEVYVAAGWGCLVLDRVHEADGHLDRALQQSIDDNASLRAEIVRLRVAVAAENEEAPRALALISEHQPLLDDERLTAQHRGKLAWAFGNAAYLAGEPCQGSELHTRASELLSPERDLHAWVRFIRASAHMRLRAGIVDEVTEALMRDAETVTRLFGADETGSGTDEIRARYAALTAPPEIALPLLEETLDTHGDALGAVMTAELHQIAADVAAAAERREDVVRHSAAAAKLFSDAGLPERASAVLERIIG